MTIYVGNLSFQAEREDLLDLFGQYGEVRQCSLPLDRETGRKRGFAFVELAMGGGRAVVCFSAFQPSTCRIARSLAASLTTSLAESFFFSEGM